MAKKKKHEEDEPLVEAVPDDVHASEDALHEAADLIAALARTTPNLMGTAHGLALIHAAQRWVAQYGEQP